MLAIIRVCVEGLETVFNSGRCTSAGAGGLASAMFLFEIAMTHYYEKAVTIPSANKLSNTKKTGYSGSKSTGISRVNSPKHMSSARSGSISTNSDASTLGVGDPSSSFSSSKVISLNDIQSSMTSKFSSFSTTLGNFLGSNDQESDQDSDYQKKTIINSMDKVGQNSETESISSFSSSTTNPGTPSKVDIRYRNGVLKRVQLENINGDKQAITNLYVKTYRVYLYEGLISDWRKKLEQTINAAHSNANTIFNKIPTFKFSQQFQNFTKSKTPEDGNPTPDRNSPADSFMSSNSSSNLNFSSNNLPEITDLKVFKNFDFWEDTWLDNVQQERATKGMEPSSYADLQTRYVKLPKDQKKLLENEEDLLLAQSLYNLTSMALTLRVPAEDVRNRVRRLLAKAHLSLAISQELSNLLDNVASISQMPRFKESGAPMVDLKPTLGVRHRRKMAFIAFFGANDESSPLVILEICDSAIIVRSGTTGVIHQRWWYDQILNVSLDENRKHVYIWRKNDNTEKDENGRGSKVAQFYCQTRCGELYRCVLSGWNKTAQRLSKFSNTNSDVSECSGEPTTPINNYEPNGYTENVDYKEKRANMVLDVANSKSTSHPENIPKINENTHLSNGNSVTNTLPNAISDASMTTVYKTHSKNPSQSNSRAPSIANSLSNSRANSRAGSSYQLSNHNQLTTSNSSSRTSSIVFNSLFNVDKNFKVDMYIGRSDVTLVQQDNRKKYSILPFSCIKKCAITKVNQLLVIEERVPGGDDTIRHRYQTEFSKEIALTFSKIFQRLSHQHKK